MTTASGGQAGSLSAGKPQLDAEEGSSGPAKKLPQGNAATGITAAGMRALTARAVAFYFRAPMKAFFRGRIDYMAYPRALNPRVQANTGWHWRVSTPAVLAHAVKTHGWGFLHNQVLPPLLANTL
jgi:hypothetical protein